LHSYTPSQTGTYIAKYKNYPKTLLKYNNESKSIHPTQKPIDLLEYLIKTYTLEKETVLDFTMGSGSTGVACLNTNRNFIGIELDQEYYKIAKDRIEAI
jgi:site-specific DNA-methyltransferase (adenine-specific)